jgi:hypothetical protein
MTHVHIRATPKYTSSSDEESSDNEVDYSDLFKGLDRTKVDKINELIDALNEKDRLLEKQEDILYDEHDKFINVQKSLALEIKKNELLSSELSTCHDSISSLKTLNDDLNTKLEKINVASSSVEHVVICNRCKDFNIDTCNEHASTILKLNNDVASLNAQLETCKDNYEKLKFSRDAYTIGRHPFINDGLGFQKETKNLTSQKTSNLNKEKGKAHMASISKRSHAYLYDKRTTSIAHHDRCYNHVVSHVCHCWGLVLKCFELRTRQHKDVKYKCPSSAEALSPQGFNELRTKVISKVSRRFYLRDHICKTTSNEK